MHDFFDHRIHQLRDYRLYLHNPGFCNPQWDDARGRVLILRLSPFADVQRSTPHLFLFREARAALPGAFIDMAFLPRPSDAEVLAEAGLPLIIGTQSHRSLSGFHIVLVSNSWLLEQVNLPFLLSRSGIPLWASERGEEWPPLILGGSNATAAHALVSESGDCMADALFFGEGERSAGNIVRHWAESAGLPKKERLSRIAAEVAGIWISGTAPASVRKARAGAPFAGAHVPAPVLPGPESATARLSITRGCPCLCSFCFEGHDRKPYRELPTEDLLRSARELKIATGASTLEVESFNFNTHSGLPVLMDGLARLFHRVNFMSQRVDILARTPGLLDLEIAGDKHSFTLGVEGISGRLRAFLHKSLADDDIRQVVQEMHTRKVRELKLFYMLTGREADADIEEFAGFVKWLKQVRQRSAAPPRVVFSFGYLVRMPFTPLRHDPPVLEESALRAVAGRVKSICETNGFEFRLSSRWPEYAATQALASGARSLHALLTQMAEAGCITDSGLGARARDSLAQWLASHGASSGEASGFPFGFLDDESSRRFLLNRYERATRGLDEGYPLERPQSSTEPRDGVFPSARALGDLTARKRRLKPLYVSVRLPRDTAGMGAPWVDAWILRAYLAAHPGEADNVLSVTGTLAAGTAMGADDLPWFGSTVAAVIAWDPERFARNLGGPFVGILDGFEPGALTSSKVRVELPADLFPDPAQRLADYLRDAHAPVTLSRAGKTAKLSASPRSLKKKLLLSGTCRARGGASVLELEIGQRPFLREWLESFGDSRSARRAIVEILQGVTPAP